jgi:hypothetical protein
MNSTKTKSDLHLDAIDARRWFFRSLAVFVPCTVIAAAIYPGGFDWVYTVVSSLAAKKYNPIGGPLFSIGFCISMAMLWPYVSDLKKIILPTHKYTSTGFVFLRLGVIAGFAMGLERILVYEWSDAGAFEKTHEILAILTFVGLYFGSIIILINLGYKNRNMLIPIVMVLIPIVAIGASQLYLYFDQRDLGWVNVEWRAMGVPIWLSFAFWQWMAVIFLYFSLGFLSFACVEHIPD